MEKLDRAPAQRPRGARSFPRLRGERPRVLDRILEPVVAPEYLLSDGECRRSEDSEQPGGVGRGLELLIDSGRAGCGRTR
jgi:hypothetical protein